MRGFITNIERAAKENENFREVFYTALTALPRNSFNNK